jgi:hypothetical protein
MDTRIPDLSGLPDLQPVVERLERIENLLANLLAQPQRAREWFTTAEAAEILHKAEFTVREWCRLQRVHAEKRACGRGTSQEWMISREEIERIQNEGLLPRVDAYRHYR